MSRREPWDTAPSAPQRPPPPGQPLRARVGTYTTFLQGMLARVPQQVVEVDGVPTRPLQGLDPGTSGDFAAALLDAWAVVGDVLTFYQARILEEGYLRTAVEARSRTELIAQLGFPLQPGISAHTMLAFNVSRAPGAKGAIRIPAGTAVQSIPGTGEQPQTFETSRELVAQPGWNALAPAPVNTTVVQTLEVGGTQARLAGTGTGLAVGAPLLAASADGSAWSFGTVTSVEADAQARETRVTWSTAPAGERGTGTMAGAAVWAFGRTTRLFGYNAAQWSSLSTEQKRAYREIVGGVFVLAGDWVGASNGVPGAGNGLPAADVRALAVDEAGRLYAGTAGRGLYVSADGGLTWTAGGPRWGDVHSLACAGPGRVFAGMSGGRVYRTTDGGATWDSLSGNVALTVPAAPPPPPPHHHGKQGDGGNPTPAPTQLVVTRLPATPVRALFDDGEGTLYAGTDFGAWSSGDVFASWTAVPFQAPGAASTSSHPSPAGPSSPPGQPPSPAVWSFARGPWGGVVAGTDAGVWSVEGGTELGLGLPALGPDGLPNVVRALYADWSSLLLLAGTDAGLYSLASAVGIWVADEGLSLHGELLPVRALAETDDGLMAATPAGVFLRDATGEWSIVGTEAPPSWSSSPASWSSYGSPSSSGMTGLGSTSAGSSSGMMGTSSGMMGSSSAGMMSSSTTIGLSSPATGSHPALVSSTSPSTSSPPVGSPPVGSPPAGSPPVASPPNLPPAAWTGDCGQEIPIPAPPGLNNSNVVALAAGMGVVAAASPYAGFPVEEWPRPPICDGVVYLSGVVPQVVPGSWIVLQQSPEPAGPAPSPPAAAAPGPPAAVAVVRVLTARTLTLERYGRSGQATEVTVEPAYGLEVFDMRYTSAFAGSRPLKLATRRLPDLVPVSGSRVKLAGAVPALPAGRTVSVSGRRIRAAVWPRAGVFARTGEQWTPAGLASVDVVAVAWGPGGVMLAAVGGDPGAAGPAAGLYASRDGGTTWTPAAKELAGVRVVALAAGEGAAWAAGPKGAMFTSVDGLGWTPAGTLPSRVTALAVAEDGTVYAATVAAGVLRRGADGTWAAAGSGLPRGPVCALATVPGGGVAAGTARGAWWLAPNATAWKAWNQGLANRNVRALAALPGGEVLAGTARGGVFSAPKPGKAWRAASRGLSGGATMVRALAAGPGGSAWVGTRGAGCFTRAPGAAQWTAAPLGAANDVRVLAGGAGGVLAGCGAVPLLVQGRGAPVKSLGLDPVLSLADPSVPDGLDQGSLSTALQGAFRDAGVTLPRTVVVRVQTKGEAWWIAAPQGVLLLRRDAGAVRVRRPNGLATLMGPPPTSPAGVPVADAGGNGGTLTPRAGELLCQSAAAGDAAVGELATVAASTSALRSTTVTFKTPLANAYDPATVQINANLAPATHGATQGAWPYPQALGSGNASQAGQSFRLPRSPLSWVPADTPEGRIPALDVYVNGVKWTRVESLYDCKPYDAAYEVRVDGNGAAAVTFGDGVNGARLPTGVANVTAQYRTGVGPTGNLGVGRLTVLRSAPLGVRTATNPVPAVGGAPGETLVQALVSGPRQARVLERVVALSDYRDYALGYPGVSQAFAESLRDPRGRPVVVVTIAGAGGAPDPGVAGELATAMAGAGARARFQVLACRVVEFVIRARVECDPRYQPQAVEAAATAKLQAEYGALTRRLGEGVAASAVVAVLQGVKGVVGVELLALYPAGQSPSVQTVLRAAGASVGAHGAVAAELLVPAATGGIVVRGEVAR